MTRPARLAFVDALRGLAVVLMVVNHTARWWLDPAAGAARDRLIYATMVLAGPTFLLLVGYSLALSFFDATVVRGRRPAEVALATLRRGLAVLAVGVGLNLVVFPHDALGARVLHSIGLGIVAATPLVGLLPHRAARSALIPAALLLYAAFMPSLPALRDWSAAHPLAAALLLREYPLFPWFGLLLIGMALGWTTVTERDAGQRARSHRVVGVTGLAGLVVFALADRSTGLADRLAFARDLTLNDYWTAAPLTALGMLGGLLCLLAAAYELVERRTWRPRGLLVLGRTALMVYVVHLVLVLPVGVRAGGIVLSGWPAYWAATGALLVLLVGVGTAWSAVRLTVSSPVWYKGRTSAKGRAPNLREGRVREA